MLAVDILTESVHPNLSNVGLWLFLEMYDEPRELYFWTCTASAACQKMAESTCMICFFELQLSLLVSPCVSKENSPQHSCATRQKLVCNRSKTGKAIEN